MPRPILSSFACLVLACSAPGTTPATDASVDAKDETPVDAGAADSARPSDGATACNALTNVGSPVTQALVAQEAPAPTGGALVDGTYVLTKYEIYTGTGGASGTAGQPLTITLALAGESYESVSTVAGADTRVSGTFTSGGTLYTVTPRCPGGAPTALAYSFDGTTLVEEERVGTNTVALTYTKK